MQPRKVQCHDFFSLLMKLINIRIKATTTAAKTPIMMIPFPQFIKDVTRYFIRSFLKISVKLQHCKTLKYDEHQVLKFTTR